MPPALPAQLVVQIGGLPRNAAVPSERAALIAAGFGVRVQGAGGLDTLLLETSTLTRLPSGPYTLSGAPATIDSVRYSIALDATTVVLAAGRTHAALGTYSALTGGLSLRAGPPLPDSLPVPVTVTYADGRVDSLQMPVRLSLLAPGPVIVRGGSVVRDGLRVLPARVADTIQITAGPIVSPTTIAYVEQRASLRLAVTGVPNADRLGFVTLTSETGVQRTLRADQDTLVFDQLLAGRYVITPQTFSVPRARYVPVPTHDTVHVVAGTPQARVLTYRRESAALIVRVVNVPEGADANVVVTGPGNFRQKVSETTTFTDVLPGSYTLVATPIAANAHTYAPDLETIVVSTAFGESPAREIRYALSTGGLTIDVRGLPDSVPAAITVTAPNGLLVRDFPWQLSTSGTRHNLPAGSYAISATGRVVGGSLYIPDPVQRTVTLLPSLTPMHVTVTYVETVGPTLDFSIDGAYLTQAAQRFDGTVPLVASREALLRVFARANEGNSEALTVRVRLLQNGTVYRTIMIPSPGSSAPLGVNEGTLAQSFNTVIAAGDVRTGMQLIADFGAAPGVSDARAENNRWPTTGSQSVDVRTVPPYSLVLVPVHHPLDGLTGDITPASADAQLAPTRAMMPVQLVSVTVHAPFSTAAPELLPNDENNGWTRVLNEMQALRLLESAGSTHYAGIVGTTYSAGIAGIANIGGRNLVAWDKPISGPRVLAHEIGHTFGRYHSPGCGASYIDPKYPYAAGAIGIWGWTGSALANPTSTNDIMGYCPVQWISDFTWNGVMSFRSTNSAHVGSMLAGRAGVAPRDSVLLLWGTVSDHAATLQPALHVLAEADWPDVGSGRYTLEVLDASGAVLQQVRFDGDAVDHASEARTFAFTVPTRRWSAPPARIRLHRGATLLTERSIADAEPAAAASAAAGATAGRAGRTTRVPDAPELRARSVATGRLQLEWNTAHWPLAVVRDATSGQVLAFVRSGSQTFGVGTRDVVSVTVSDGVRSVTRLQRIR